MNKFDLLKSHIEAFTRKDGSVVQAHEDKRVAKPADQEFGVHHSKLKEGDHLYDKQGQKVDEVEGFSRGINSPRVHTRAGYTHGTRSDGMLIGLSNKKPGEVGDDERQKYGTHFKKGDQVKDRYGKTHEVADHSGPVVRTTGGESFHPTKVSKVEQD